MGTDRRSPSHSTRRPPEPLRPLPARRPGGTTTIQVAARRRRWRRRR